MTNAKKYYRPCVLGILVLVLCVIITAGGCSTKKKKKSSEKSYPVKIDNNIPPAANEVSAPKPAVLPLPDINQTAQTSPAEANQIIITEINEPCEASESIATFLKEFNKTKDSDKKVELLGSLFDRASEQDPCIIGIVQKEVSDKDGNVAQAAIDLLQGYESPEVLPVIGKAMKNPNEDVRQTAVNYLLDINAPQTGELLTAALTDESEDIRNTALDITKYKDNDIQYKVLGKAISSQYDDVKDNSVFMLQYLGGRGAVDVLIEALRDKNPEFRESVTSAISTLIDKEFDSYKDAKNWWEKNRDKYDDELSPIEEEK